MPLVSRSHPLRNGNLGVDPVILTPRKAISVRTLQEFKVAVNSSVPKTILVEGNIVGDGTAILVGSNTT